MNTRISTLLGYFFIFLMCFTHAFAAAPLEPSYGNADTILNDVLNRTITNFDPNLNIGLVVQDAATGRVLYQKNPHRYYLPASNQKLFTALAALYFLSPKFTYQTRLYADPTKVQNGILNGDVYLQFSGDPTLTLTQLDHLISGLTQIGVKAINGNLIVDDSLMDMAEMSPGTTWDDKAFCYGAPISALVLNHNCITATLSPAATTDQPATLSVPTEPQFIRIVNNVMTHSPLLNEDCGLTLDTSDEKSYVISGCLKTTDNAKKLMMAVKNPHSYLYSALFYVLQNNHIQGSPKVIFKKITQPPKLIATAASPPLKALITKMLKESDNLIANTLFKTLGALYYHQQGNWQNGSSAVKAILQKATNITLPEHAMIDGDGRSRYNLLTPDQVAALLQRAYTSPYAPVFIAALPVSGIDGSLRERLKNKITYNRIRAKTGTETSATALSGFLITNKRQLLIFSILINGFVDLPIKYQQLQDQICTALISNA